MRKLILALALIFCFAPLAQANVRNIQDNYKFVYNVLDTSGAHVTGQAPTVQIQKVSNGYWFDFSDSTFKVSGWTNKTTALTEDATDGFYFYLFNPPASETTAEEYVFVVNNSDATYADHQILVVDYQNIGTGTATLAAADVWTVGTRVLTAGTNIALAKGSGITGFNDIAATDVWAAGTRTLTSAATTDWTSDEKADILAALGITDGAPTVTLDSIYQAIKVHR